MLQQYTLGNAVLTETVVEDRAKLWHKVQSFMQDSGIGTHKCGFVCFCWRQPQPQFKHHSFLIQLQLSNLLVYMTKGRIFSMILSDYNEPQLLLKKYTSRECPQYSLQQRMKPIELSPSTDSPQPHAKNMPVYKYMQKRKMVHKPKMRMYHSRHDQKFIGLKSVKRDINIFLNIDKAIKSKHEITQLIFDWMMEAASLLKLTKNAYYRSIIIFKQINEKDTRILLSKKLSHLVCGCLIVGAKFQNSSYGDYLRRMFLVNARRVSRQQLILAEHQVLQLLQWQVPAHTQIEQQLSEVIRKWNDFIKTVSGQFQEPRHLNKLLINSWDKDNNKLYVQIVTQELLVVSQFAEFYPPYHSLTLYHYKRQIWGCSYDTSQTLVTILKIFKVILINPYSINDQISKRCSEILQLTEDNLDNRKNSFGFVVEKIDQKTRLAVLHTKSRVLTLK